MSKKNKKNKIENKDKTESVKAFTVHTEAVNDLVNANEDNSPEVSEKELKEFRKDKFEKIPAWLKALFIKFWFNGAMCFFFVWGLGLFLDNLDLIFVLGIAMGVVNDILVNNILRFLDVDNEYLRWTLFPNKKLWTFFANIVYSFVILFIVIMFYAGSNIFINGIAGLAEFTVKFQVEPFSFGLLYLLIDLVFVGIKNFFIKLVNDANKKLTISDREKQANENKDK